MKNLKDIPCDELRAYAREQAQTVTVRTYNNLGCSDDAERPSTPDEARIIETIIYGALLAIRSGHGVDGVANGVEYVAIVQLNVDGSDKSHINTYDSVYLPIRDYVREAAK